LSNTENLLKPGMFGRVFIETDRVRGAVVVPREAIQRDKLGSYVTVVDRSGKAVRRPVTEGVDETSFVSIEQGVRPGEKVIVTSAFPVREGQIVRAGGRKGGEKGLTGRQGR